MPKSWLLIALGLAAIFFVACGSEAETATVAPAATQQTPTQTAVPTDTPAPTLAPTTAPTKTPVPAPTPTIVPVLQVMEGFVVDAVARDAEEIELLVVRAFDGRIWEFVTEGPIGIDAAHLLVHRDTEEGVEVVFLDQGGRTIALEVNDLAR